MKKALFALCIVASLQSGALFAEEEGGLKPILRMGFDFGGERLAKVLFTDGTTQEIAAGDGLYFSGGVSFPTLPGNKDLSTEATFGYKFSSITGANGEITWDYWQLELIERYNLIPEVALGVGVTMHMNPALSGSGVASSLQADFDDAMGFVLEAGYTGWAIGNLGVRMTSIEYTSNGVTYDGNSTGIYYMLKF